MPQLQNDAGHGSNTYPPSKGVPGLAEHTFNAAVGSELKRLLAGKIPTYEAQTFGAKDVALSTRTNLYNAQYIKNKDAIGMSHHANANKDPDRRGIGIFYWHKSSKGKKLAEMILEEYKKEFPDREKYPIWGDGLFPCVPGTWTNLHMCRETSAPFVLIEWEFMTNKESLELLKSDDYRKRCALVAARVACHWYGIQFEDKEVAKVANKTNEKADAFAQEAQEWAKEMGISDGSNPRDSITRQEIWVMLQRLYEKVKG